MPFWKNQTDTVIINEVDDEPDSVTVSKPTKDSKQKKRSGKKKEKEKGMRGGGDSMAELSEEAREGKEEKAGYKKDATCMDHVLFNKKLRLVYVLLLCLLLGIIIPYIISSTAFKSEVTISYGTCALNVSYRFECVPGRLVIGEDECHQLGCCYDTNKLDDTSAPVCFHSIPPRYRYVIANETESSKRIYRLGEERKLDLYLDNVNEYTPFGTRAWPLRVLIQRKKNDIIRIKLWNEDYIKDTMDDFQEESCVGDCELDVEVDATGGKFNITVLRRGTKKPLMETIFGPLVYGEDYMEITTRLPTAHLYGLGQRERETFELLPNFNYRTRWTLFNRDGDAGATYGSHPFYMNFEEDGKMHGVYLRNSAPVEVGVLPIPAVVFRSVDGIFDFRILAGPSPKDVTKQYTSLVGLPEMPPFWALGYHLCRTTLNDTEYESVVDRMLSDEVPYESDCIDARLNYPDPFASFSDRTKERVSKMKEDGRRFLFVQYPYVPVTSDAYGAVSGEKLFLKLNNSQPYYGLIEDTVVGYPDYCNENAFANWMNKTNIRGLYANADGVMLLQNTPLNTAIMNYSLWIDTNGAACNATQPEVCCPSGQRKFLPFGLGDFNEGTVCSDARHTSKDVPSLQLHNAYGRCHHERVHDLMKDLNPNKRFMVTSLSTHPGSGSLGGHFGGQYPADFVAQRKSLTQMLEMGLYGVPLVGVPVCGSTNGSSETPCLLPTHRYFIRQRYMILPYLYTLFHEAALSGTPVLRPLFYEFPEDLDSRNNAFQFMLGDALLITPVYSSLAGSTSVQVNARFPPASWYDFYTGSLVSSSSTGENLVLSTLLTDVNVHVKGGTIVPMQGNLHEFIRTTEDLREKPYHILVVLTTNITTTEPTTTPAATTASGSSTENPKGVGRGQDTIHATGRLYLDDGVTPLSQNPAAHNLMFTAEAGLFNLTRTGNGCENSAMSRYSSTVDIIRIFGAPKVTEVKVNNARHEHFTQDYDTLAILITKLDYDWCTKRSLIVTWE
ncbi:sucrase-isomaltase, intestinal-like [Penaeus indicus]|uniref:sucrase-isomaltase, intestinal-like n=1 Tax=Penaeus indicus TaxID=29960 RepID=UPI00300C452B